MVADGSVFDGVVCGVVDGVIEGTVDGTVDKGTVVEAVVSGVVDGVVSGAAGAALVDDVSTTATGFSVLSRSRTSSDTDCASSRGLLVTCRK